METASILLGTDVVDMTWNVKMASNLLANNPKARSVLRTIDEGRGRASGWDIVRTLGLPPEEVSEIISQFKSCGVIESTDSGLDGYYFLTKLGFSLRNGYSVAV